MNVKGSLAAVAAAALVALAGCGAHDGASSADAAAAGPSRTAAMDPSAPHADGPVPPPSLADGAPPSAGSAAERSALGALNAVNDHEIAAGQQALSKGVQGRVADYAKMMIDEHSESRQRTAALGADTGSADAGAQRDKGRQELDMLGASNGKEYEIAYIDAMVRGHAEALEALDVRFIPAAETEAAKAHLVQTRERVAQHLRTAQEIQATRP